MELWYRKLGFYSNPFSIKPGAFHDEVIGHELSDLLEKIENGRIQYIKADYGNGKTTLLKHIKRRFGGKRMVAFTSCNIADNFDTKKLLMGRALINKAFSIMPRNMILLVDEAQDITLEGVADILENYKSGSLKSVVFFGAEIKHKNIPKELSNYLGGNIITLSRLSPEKAVEIIRKRIGNLNIISDSLIRKLYSISSNNPRKLLENCEDLCRHAASKNRSSATEADVRELFGRKLIKKVHKPKPRKNKKRHDPEIKIEEIDERSKDKVNTKFDYSNIRTYEEEMAFGRNL